jgi:hypothetical protein
MSSTRLTVKEGKMSAVLTLSGTGYEKLYMGTGEERWPTRMTTAFILWKMKTENIHTRFPLRP